MGDAADRRQFLGYDRPLRADALWYLALGLVGLSVASALPQLRRAFEVSPVVGLITLAIGLSMSVLITVSLVGLVAGSARQYRRASRP